MGGPQTGKFKPAATRAGPPWWARALVYGFTWLPVLVVVLVFAHRYEPIFKKLEEKGELPWLTQWLMAFDRVNAVSFYLPALLLVLAVLVVDQAAVRILRRKARGKLWSWLWVASVGLVAIPAQLLVVLGLVLPVFKMSSTVP